MLAAGRSFPVATTVRRASARTAATGRAWRATPASFPGNNVRGLSSEGTPGTVAGAQAAGATPPPTPPLRGGGASSGGGGSGGGSGGDGGGGGGVGGAAVKVVVLTAAVVGANMAAYAKVPAVKKMVDEKLEGPLPPEVYDIYRRCGVDVSPPYWKIRSERKAWDFGVMRKIKEEARRLSPFNSNNSAKPTERSKGGGFEIDASGITKKGFSVSSRADENEDKNAAATAAVTTLPTTTATTTTTTEPTELVTREQGAASSPSPWERRDSSSPAPLPSNASNAAETAGGDDDGDWEAGAAAALAEAEAADNLAVAAVPEGGGSSSAADAADSAPSPAREARAAVVPLAGDGGRGADGTGDGEIADHWEQEAGSAAAASAAVDAAAADAAGDVSAVTADVEAGGDAAGVVEVGTAEEEEEAVAVRELESKKRRIRNEALSKVAEEMEVASAGLKRELEHSMLKDLKELDEDSLRFRVAQLATEMQESAKWESLRLMDGVKKMEAEIARKYETLLSEQKELYRSETGKALREQEEELAATFMEDYNKQLRYHLEHQANEFKEALHASATAGQDALRDELEAKHADEVDALKAEELKNAEAVLREVKDLSHKTEETLTVLEAARIAEEADKAASETVHRVTHATLALAERFAGSGPIGPELDNLLRLSGGDPLLEAAAGSIPRAAASKGISTVPQLRQRFGVVKKECRRAALMPEGAGGGLFGYLMASVLAKITFVPKGMMDGEGAEVALARADHLLEAGELKSAVGEVEKLSGLPADVAEDWLRDAKTRLIADEALRVFRCHASLLNAKQIAHLDRKA